MVMGPAPICVYVCVSLNFAQTLCSNNDVIHYKMVDLLGCPFYPRMVCRSSV